MALSPMARSYFDQVESQLQKCSTLEGHKNKIESFSTIAAKAYFLQGKRSSQIRILFSPIFRFIKDYFLRFGFLDGSLGWFIASLTFKEIKLKYKKLLDIQNET